LPTPEVIVLGAGPAGSTLARLLATSGIAVFLVDRPKVRQHMPEETLPPTAAPILEGLGLQGLFTREQFFGTPRRSVHWNPKDASRMVVQDLAPHERGFKVGREILDRELRGLAVNAGATRVEADVLAIDGTSKQVRIRTLAGHEQTLNAAVIVNALGARGSLLSGSVSAQLPDTLALTATVDQAHASLDTTVIEAVPEGWLWWIPRAIGGAALTLMVDAAEARKVGAHVLHQRALQQSLGPARGLKLRCDQGTAATARLVLPHEGVLHCGDAASGVDPLSSQGLMNAFLSARRTFEAIRTLLESPHLDRAVQHHLNQFHRAHWREHARTTLAWYASEQRFAEAPFWQSRHQFLLDDTPSGTVKLPRCFVRTQRLVPAPLLVSDGERLRERMGYQSPRSGDAIHEIGRLSVDQVLKLTEQPGSFEDCCRRAGAIAGQGIMSREELRGILHEASTHGFIETWMEDLPRERAAAPGSP
jgi:flavin-dependent dehydrogenase